MRRRIIRKYRELDSVDQTVKLIDDMCQKSRLRYSDVEQFMDENALSRIDAKIVLDTVHNGESQFSMFWFHRKVNGVSFIEEVDEQAEAYPRHATLNQKLFAMNATSCAYDTKAAFPFSRNSATTRTISSACGRVSTMQSIL